MRMGQNEQTPIILIGTEEEPRIYLGTEANFTDIDKKNIEENSKARHIHNNKEILDGITQENIDNWNNKSNNNGDYYTKKETDTKLKNKQDGLIFFNRPLTSEDVYEIWETGETNKFDIETLDGLVKEVGYVRTFDTYENLVQFYDDVDVPGLLNEPLNKDYYTPIGKTSIYIKTLNVPDLWVMDRVESDDSEPFTENIIADAENAGMTLDKYIVNQLKLNGEFSIKWLKFAPLETQKADLTNIPTKDEVVLTPTIANVGQTIMVKEVDESGKPTKWEATDIGGGSATEKTLELLYEGETIEEVITISVTTDTNGNTFELKELYAEVIMPKPSTQLAPYIYFADGISCHTITSVNDNTTLLVSWNRNYPYAKVDNYAYYYNFKTSVIKKVTEDIIVNQFRMKVFDGVFPIGTKLKVWGKRVQ